MEKIENTIIFYTVNKNQGLQIIVRLWLQIFGIIQVRV